MEISKIRVDETDYDIKDVYPTNLSIEGEQSLKLTLSNDEVLEVELPTSSGNLKNYTLMIGDSYAEGVNPNGAITGWCERTKELLGLADDEFLKLYEGGAGFVKTGNNGNTFLTLLQANISKYNSENVKNIILCAGYNDYAQTFENIQTAIQTFIEYCKTNFPNARIYFGMVGNDGGLNTTSKAIRQNLAINVLPAYKQCVKYGASYLNGVENILKYYPFISTDNIHPTEDGQQELAIGICESFRNGYYEFMTQPNFVMSEKGLLVTYELKGDNVTITTNAQADADGIGAGNVITFSTAITARETIDLGQANIEVFRLTHENFPKIQCEYFLMQSNKFYGGKGWITIDENNHFILDIRYLLNDGTAYPSISNIGAVCIYNNAQTIPTRYC